MSTYTWADAALDTANDAGVEVCFANPGTTEMWFVSALEKSTRTRTILGLHETVCCGAADGYGRMARKPAMTLLHLGPGLANGLANLHNARRARTPLLNIIGTMSSFHEQHDPPLNMDVDKLAATVSRSVVRVQKAEDVRQSVQEAMEGTQARAPANKQSVESMSRIATLLVPHDFSWESAASSNKTLVNGVPVQVQEAPHHKLERMRQFAKMCADEIRKVPRGGCALYLGGCAMLAEGSALPNAGKVCSATGSTLLCETSFSRIDRGAGLPHIKRLPYFPQEGAAELKKYQLLVVLDAKVPVAQFGYKDAPCQLVAVPEEQVWEFDDPSCVPAVLEILAEELGGNKIQPGVNCRGVFPSSSRPPLPSGPLNPATLCAVIAALQPEDAILVDESLTSGNAYWEASKGCPPFTHLTLTGGAIGSGPPMAVGAAVACPHRQVINFQADGSGMYSLQALWTQAREKLKVLTIICANNIYAILKVECMRQRIPNASGPVTRKLTELGHPPLDWVHLAHGMGVPAARAKTCEELVQLMKEGLAMQGPFLIQADL